MLLLLISLASATHVKTYEPDVMRTKGPFSGMESLIVDAKVFIAQAQPLSAAPGGAVEVFPNEKGGSASVMVFTNPGSSWAWLTINGTKVGTINPYGTITVDGLHSGWYELDLLYPNGFTRKIAIELK